VNVRRRPAAGRHRPPVKITVQRYKITVQRY
jgi:hypothetical protein